MLAQIVALLLGTAADLLTLAFLGRVWMQWSRAPFRNPLGHFIAVATDWAVLPLRRFIPGLFGIDLASVFAAWLAQVAFHAVMATLAGASADAFVAALWIAAVAVPRLAVYLAMGIVIVAAVLSWINPHSPFRGLFDALAQPLLAPVRRFVPLLGGIDLAPLVVLLLLQVVLIVLGGLLPGTAFLPR